MYNKNFNFFYNTTLICGAGLGGFLLSHYEIGIIPAIAWGIFWGFICGYIKKIGEKTNND